MINNEYFLTPEWEINFKNKISCGFTLPITGNLSHTRDSVLSGFSTLQNKINLLKNLDLTSYSYFSPLQIHTDIIIEVNQFNKNNGFYDKSNAIEGDGCITKEHGILLVTTWADCVPVIFYEFNKNIIASVHSGWKSTYKQIVNKTVEKIIEMGGSLDSLLVAIGPAIKNCCYEVGSEFLTYFKGYDECFIYKEEKLFFDPSLAVYKQLLDIGVKKENIELSNLCTKCSGKPEFFSFRRDPVNFEGQGAFIALKSF